MNKCLYKKVSKNSEESKKVFISLFLKTFFTIKSFSKILKTSHIVLHIYCAKMIFVSLRKTYIEKQIIFSIVWFLEIKTRLRHQS